VAEIFVFGSNLLGIHKRGAALCALNEHGAILGQGVGLQGNSYAIPTKRTPYASLSLEEINKFVADFLLYALYTPLNRYLVTPIGCGLAGYTPEDIAPMFYYATSTVNIQLPPEFTEILQ
jgi:hypothetical protein